MNAVGDIDLRELSDDYVLVEKAIAYLDDNASRQPELSEVASAVGLSEFHFQRVFTRWAGISPKRFLQFLTRERARELLEQSGNMLDTSYKLGLSSPGRLHDLFVSTEAVSPGEYKSLWRGRHNSIRHRPDPLWEMPVGCDGPGNLSPGICPIE